MGHKWSDCTRTVHILGSEFKLPYIGDLGEGTTILAGHLQSWSKGMSWHGGLVGGWQWGWSPTILRVRAAVRSRDLDGRDYSTIIRLDLLVPNLNGWLRDTSRSEDEVLRVSEVYELDVWEDARAEVLWYLTWPQEIMSRFGAKVLQVSEVYDSNAQEDAMAEVLWYLA